MAAPKEEAIAIIGGTGVRDFPFEESPREESVTTRYGTATVLVGRFRDRPVLFLPRHGSGHTVPPHRIPYRSNIAALKRMNVRAVIATTAVGSLRPEIPPGEFVLIDDFIDFTTRDRGGTFFDEAGQVVHTDFTVPYSPEARSAVRAAARRLGVPLRDGGTYLCADGPRFESPAEVRVFASWGADVVGMTGVPEVTLAREAGIHYAGISLVANLGAGISPNPLTHAEVEEAMRMAAPRLMELLRETIANLDPALLPAIGPGVDLPGLSGESGG